MAKDLNELKIEAEKEVKKAENLAALDQVYKKYLGKKGELAAVFVSLKIGSESQRKKMGQVANSVKKEIEKTIEQKTKLLKDKSQEFKLGKEKLDITRPGQKLKQGHLHPITLVQRELTDIFQSMGFEAVQGQEVESEWYNFDALNVPKDHPARDMQDTFWFKQKFSQDSKNNFLPRTHTSPVQVRYMEKHNPPLKIVVPGRVFRNEATDGSHEVQFYQLEGLMVDKKVSAANFRAIIEEVLKRFFKTEVEIRLRPGYFPFVEPGFEIDARRKPQTRTSTVRGEGGQWLEMLGAGMVHPNVLKAAGLNPKEWQGFAFGVGMERLAMVKYKIHDIRFFYQNDLRFLKQF